MHIETCTEATMAAWVALRTALWPEAAADRLRCEAPGLLVNPDILVLVALESGDVIGFAEVTFRRDYVNGCKTSPVAFLEGIYVRPEARRCGAATALVAGAESWARRRGLAEFASDALLDNRDAHTMHAALGFEETERVVYFRKTVVDR